MMVVPRSSEKPAPASGVLADAETEEILPSAGVGSRQGPAEGCGPARPQTVIQPRSGWIPIDWRELWEFRELLYFLVWRDVKVRYKQTVLGVAWAVLQPVLSMIVFTVIFGRLAKIPSEGLPYAVFVYAGLLPWTFFSNGVTHGGQSLINQQHLLTKVYLPRLFLPSASIGGALVDLAISFGVYGVILAIYGVMPSWQVAFVPLLVLLTVVAALGLSLLLAALTVAYRDFRYVVPFMLQALLYLSPVVYPVSLVPQRFHWLLALNPMAGIIDGYRAAILDKPWNLVTLTVSTLSALGLLAVGLLYFRMTERKFADIA
jgi:lipopolysaccharide transport system permease protein